LIEVRASIASSIIDIKRNTWRKRKKKSERKQKMKEKRSLRNCKAYDEKLLLHYKDEQFNLKT